MVPSLFKRICENVFRRTTECHYIKCYANYKKHNSEILGDRQYLLTT